MKTWALFLASLAVPSSLLAQDVQVRIYSAHPPTTLEVQAIEGHLHWKACATCQEQTGESLSVESPKANPSASPKAAQQEFLIIGTYRLRPASGPEFSSPYPVRIQAPHGGLIIVVTVPLEQYVQHVLMAESGTFRNPEALKAMAVAARSYANKFIGQHAKEGLQVFSTLDSYRNTTGQPAWVAASTRGQTIRLQPLADLRRRSILEPTLRHELYHLLVETHAARNVPLWFREGLTLYLSSSAVPDASPSSMTIDQIEQALKHGDTRENMQKAYGSAQRIFAGLILKHGKQAVLAWLNSGLPPDVLRSLGVLPATTPRSGADQQPRAKP